MDRRCERCGRLPEEPGYLYDYCAQCCANLCPACMDTGCCGSKPALSGYEAEDNDGEGGADDA